MEPNAGLIITDGGVTGLVAAASGANGRVPGNPGGPVLWHQGTAGPTGPAMERAVRRQAELYGLLLDVAPAGGLGESGGTEGELVALYRAGLAAAKRAFGELVWPVSVGAEFELKAAARWVDRALLVSRLVALDAGPTAPVFLTPYADLTDAQIADLILDMDLPIWTCWWYEGGAPEADAERERWTAALRKAGWKGALPGPEVVTKVGLSGRAAAR